MFSSTELSAYYMRAKSQLNTKTDESRGSTAFPLAIAVRTSLSITQDAKLNSLCVMRQTESNDRMIPFGWTNGWCRTSWLGHRASIANDTRIVLDVEQTERLQLPQEGGDAPIQISQIAEREEVRIQASVDDVLRELAGNNDSRGIDGVPNGLQDSGRLAVHARQILKLHIERKKGCSRQSEHSPALDLPCTQGQTG